MEEEEINNESFMNKIKELKSKKKDLISNMKNSKSKVGNEAVLDTIMSAIKEKK